MEYDQAMELQLDLKEIAILIPKYLAAKLKALKLPGGNFRGLIEDLKIEMIKIVTMAAATMYNGDILNCVFLLSFG